MQEKELERIGSMPRVFLDGLGVGISLIDALPDTSDLPTRNIAGSLAIANKS